MYEQNLFAVITADPQKLGTEDAKNAKAKEVYCAPQIFVVGKTVDLLQGGYGGYYDCPPDGYYSQSCW